MNRSNKIMMSVSLVAVLCGIQAYGMDIFQAAEQGNVRVIKRLIAAQPKEQRENYVNQKDGLGITPLCMATMYGHKKVVQVLINADADIELQDDSGRTPLHIASLYGNVKIAQALIAAGANLRITTSNGYTPKETAHILGHRLIVDLISGCEQRIEKTRTEITQPRALACALAFCPRLGAQSPMSLLDQSLMRYINILVAKEDELDARQIPSH